MHFASNVHMIQGTVICDTGRYRPFYNGGSSVSEADPIAKRHYKPVFRLTGKNEPDLTFSVPPPEWLSDGHADSKLNRLLVIGVDQSNSGRGPLTADLTNPGQWAIDGVTTLGSNMLNRSIEAGSPMFVIPCTTTEFRNANLDDQFKSYTGPVYADLTAFTNWMNFITSKSRKVETEIVRDPQSHPVIQGPKRRRTMPLGTHYTSGLEAFPLPFTDEFKDMNARDAITVDMMREIFPQEDEAFHAAAVGPNRAHLFAAFNQTYRWTSRYHVGKLTNPAPKSGPLQVVLSPGAF